MARLVYTPEGADPRSWEFDPLKMASNEAILIEDVTGLTYQEWIDTVMRGSMRAMHALLWVLMKRDIPDLDPDALVFTLDEVDFEADKKAPKAPADRKAPAKKTATRRSA